MKNLFYFSRKELFESWKTSKFLILISIFLIFGLMSPLLAKLSPEIMKATVGKVMANSIPKPTSVDSWTQFYKNLTQLGLVVLALMFSGTVNNEVNKGTLINLVTKGLRRWTIITAKMLSFVFQWTICLFTAFMLTWGYNKYYFPDEKSKYFIQAVIPLWIFGVMLVGIVLFFSTICRSNYEGLLLSGGVIVLLVLLNLFDDLKHYNPVSLASKNVSFLQGTSNIENYLPAMFISILLFLLFIFLSIVVFNKKSYRERICQSLKFSRKPLVCSQFAVTHSIKKRRISWMQSK